MHLCVRSDAAALKLGRNSPRRGVYNDLLHSIAPFLPRIVA
jgi:hypothetical protein